MHILVTNDDGIESVGLWVLAQSLFDADLGAVTIVAPEQEQSGMSMALPPRSELTLRRVAPPAERFQRLDAYAFSGTPVGCVMAGMLSELWPRPDVIVSGINRGLNSGTNVLLSGTVGAAMFGALWGRPAMAVSQLFQGDRSMPWGTAGWAAAQCFPLLESLQGRGPLVLNLNVPHVDEISAIKGFRQTELSSFFYGSVVEMVLEPEPIDDEGRRRLAYRFLRERIPEFPESTDDGAVRAGYVSISVLTPTGVALDIKLDDALASL